MKLELFIGPMFAGKSSSIIGILRRHAFIRKSTLVLTSSIDTRYSSEGYIVSHNNESYPALAFSELIPLINTDSFNDSHCIVIEEAQFFPDLKNFVLMAVETHGKHVICVGLDGDSNRKPFGQILDLIPYADTIAKFQALCSRCADGTEAIFTYRKPGAPSGQINVGTYDMYEALCRKHYLNLTAAVAT
jgi:thymidine kinase